MDALIDFLNGVVRLVSCRSMKLNRLYALWNLIKNTRSPLSTIASGVFHSKGFASQIIAFLPNYINIVGLVYFPTNSICKKSVGNLVLFVT